MKTGRQTAHVQRLLEVHGGKHPPDAELAASASKSITHRAVLMGLLVPHLRIENPLLAADTAASLRLAHALGATSSAEPLTPAASRLLASLQKDGLQTIHARHGDQDNLPSQWDGIELTRILRPDDPHLPAALLAAPVHLHVEGPHAGTHTKPLPVQHDKVDLGNSGTSLRLGAALAALGDRPITLTGDDSLLQRPMGPLADALQELGATCTLQGENGRPPVQVQGPITGQEATLEGGVSSQYVSALLLAAHGSAHPLTLRIQGRLASAPYIRLTTGLLADLGARIDQRPGAEETVYQVLRDSRLHAGVLKVPGDWSSAAFPLVAAAVTRGRVRLSGLERESPQGDRVVLDALQQAGCRIEWRAGTTGKKDLLELSPGERPLQAVKLDLNATPDLLPPLGVLAARASGTSRFTGIAHARIKETDRIAATAKGLSALGFDVFEEEDALEITGDATIPLPEATIETHGDHRILMAFAVLALTGPGPVRLTEPGCYHVSYPRFRLDLDALGGSSSVVAQEGHQ